MLQASHHEVAIKYAIVALGALHEGCVRGDSRIRREGEEGSRLSFATSQYVKAIGQFCDPERKEKKRMDVVLITCILFICFEVSDISGTKIGYCWLTHVLAITLPTRLGAFTY